MESGPADVTTLQNSGASDLPRTLADLSEDMAAYDRLHPAVRRALRRCPQRIAAGPLLEWQREERANPSRFVAECVQTLEAVAGVSGVPD